MRSAIWITVIRAVVVALSLAVTPELFAQSSRTTPATASADIVDGISLSKVRDLNFGDIFPNAAGTVTVTPAGIRTATGGSVLIANPLNAPTSASFDTLRIGSGNPKYWIRLPADGTVIISNGTGGTMAVNTFIANVNCSNTSGIPPGNSGTCPSAPGSFQVGATLTVGAAQPFGLYAGTFNVTVTRF